MRDVIFFSVAVSFEGVGLFVLIVEEEVNYIVNSVGTGNVCLKVPVISQVFVSGEADIHL